jgi:hypothetical protein
VKVLGPGSLAFPDYPGNNMFNTLGNLERYPRAGLLFLDFETGSTLQLVGRAILDWPRETEGSGPPGAGRHAVVSFELELAVETRGGGVTGRVLGGSGDAA